MPKDLRKRLFTYRDVRPMSRFALPKYLYHCSMDLPAVARAGKLKAGKQVAAAGEYATGDISFTTRKDVAERICRYLTYMAEHRDDPAGVEAYIWKRAETDPAATTVAAKLPVLAKLRPERVGYLRIASAEIPPGKLAYDVRSQGLSEILVEGPVPVTITGVL